jgi:1-acyl-sn-glycerol-3-phosphate acyltransferase
MPGVGVACEKVGHIFVDRSNPEAARRSVNAAIDQLGDGVGILFFPEGTRSDDGRLLPFKKGAFRIALDEQLPVLPVTLVGTRKIMPARSLRVFPGSVTMVVHEPIETRGLGSGDLLALMNRARDSIASALPKQGTG